jgi:DNA-directed RNA polymerase specialized sigma24 family protein
VAQKAKNSKGKKKLAAPIEPVPAHEKIARLLGVLATKDMEQIPERVVLLRAVGFEISEVASILSMTENHVRVASHQGRKNRTKLKATARTRQKH